jgi:hypothetical protein
VQPRAGIFVLLEFLSTHDQVRALIVFDEYLDVCLRGNHLRGVVEGLTLVTDRLAYFSEDVGKLLDVVFHEVYLRVIVFLHPVQPVAVLVSNLVYVLIDQLDVTFVLVFSLSRCQLKMVYLLLQGGCQ